MKKLKLRELGLKNSEVLSREQLKNILGGLGSGGSGYEYTCTANCGEGTSVTCYGDAPCGCSAADNQGCTGHNSGCSAYYISCY